MAKRKTSSFLPQAYQSDKNKKFLSATLDQLMNSANLQRLDGYVGRKYSPGYKSTDNYINSTGLRRDYQLEPAIVVKKDSSITSDNSVGSIITYDDLLYKLKNNSVNTTNHNKLFDEEFYNWAGFINFDSLINYGSYYWLKDGPNAVNVTGSKIKTTGSWTTTYDSVNNRFTVTEIAGNNPTIYLVRGGTYTFTADQTADFYIQTEEGSITGVETTSPTKSTREIYGVENNGSKTSLTFTVPQVDAQSWFDTNLTLLQDVNLVSDLAWNKVQGRNAEDLISSANGIDNQRVLEGKTVTFLQNSDSLTDNNNWTTTGVDYTTAPYIDTGFSVTTGQVSTVDRQGVFRINIVNSRIVLSKIANVTFTDKIYITEGTTYAGRHFYKETSTNHLTVVPVLTAKLDTLYYQHGTNKTTYGTIKIANAVTTSIESTDFLGKKTYTAPNGIVFTNGLKITFDTTISETKYQNKSYYIEGVGDKIHLVDTTLVAPETDLDNKDYIVMTRGATDKNAWSRGNKWFHKDIITTTATYNSEVTIIDDSLRAVRPIIQYDAGLHLFNHGTIGVSGMELIDTTTTDALSSVHGSSGYYVDGVSLSGLDNIIFAKDNDLQTRKNPWAIGWRDIDGDSTAETMTLTDYDKETVTTGSSIYFSKGTVGKGKTYHWDGANWIASQTKTKVNQYPIFKLYDSTGININDTTTYPASDFLGNSLFKYTLGTGKNDTIIGIPLKYRTFNNVGDILFDNTYVNDTFNYKKTTGVATVSTATTLAKKTHPYSNTVSYTNGWEKGIQHSRQFQQIEYTVDDIAIKSYDLGANPDTSVTALPNVFVYINNKRTTAFTIALQNGLYSCKLTNTQVLGDSITIQFFSKTTSKSAYYVVPKNLESNGQNEKFTNITLGQLQNHVSALVDTNKFFTGSLQGSNNLRDLENYKATEGLITQHSSSMILPMLLSQQSELNYVDSLKFANSEYEKFKSKFLTTLETLDNLDLTNVSATVDTVMESVNANKSSTFPFYTSDMIPYGADADVITYTITDDRDKTYEVSSVFDNTVPGNRAILVYLNNAQLYHGLDYTFETESSNVKIIKTITIGDVLKIVDYTNTLGNYVAPTPTKLGLYPKFKPEIVSDDTYAVTQNVIVGHDGSRTIAYGDNRDNVILELEKRMYNNIKTEYQETVFNIKKYTPGRFRATDITEAQVNDILEDEFLRWVTKHRIPYTENTTFDANVSTTWNYKNFTDSVDKTVLQQGHWKGLFRYYFDTYKPHTNSWEMFGWSQKPSWWETRYGPAPYTSGNKVLWNDVKNGHRYTSAKVDGYTVDLLYKRADIYSLIPVTENGQLKSPIDCLSPNSGDLSPSHAWKFGDGAASEHAWRNSSSYPFSVQHLMSLIRPAEYLSQVFNKSQIVRNTLTDQLVMTLTNQRQTPTDLKVDTSTTRYEGCGNYVADYLRWLNVDVKTNLTNIITTLDIKLVHKLEGYTDKKLIKVLAEQVSPSSTSNSVYIPDEDYSVHLHKTGPIKSIPYSGVIVQGNASGYTVYGYDLTNPRFTIHKPIENGNFRIHDVNEEKITEWEDYYVEESAVAYGTTFNTKQDVADFMFSYQKYLTTSGYDFDNRMEDFGSQKIVANWAMSVKEFVHWSGQGWLPGSVITLSPSSSRIRCITPIGIADALSNSQAQTNVLNQKYEPLRPNTYKMSRSDGEFELYPNLDKGGIYFVNTKLVQYEHVLVFNNITKFNDVIYQPGLGNRQHRLRLVGYKTGGWDGSLTAEGFIYNDGDVPSWVANTNYVRGDIVTFRDLMYTSKTNHTSTALFIYENWTQTDSFKIGLLPNFDTLGKNFESFYDVNTVNLESETDKYGKGAISYQNRSYFDQIGLDDVSQVKFYQGMLQEKGTKNAVDKLIRSKFDQISSDISYYEEWAIRNAAYGATDLNSRVEILLDEEGFTDNPQPITLHKTTQNKSDVNSKVEYTTSQLYKAPSDITYDWVPVRKPFVSGHKNNIFYDELYPNVGYPKLTDADGTLFYNKDADTLKDILYKIKIGFTLWIAEDSTGDWDMRYLDTTATEVVNCDGGADGETYTWTTTDNHSLAVGDIIAIKNYHTDGTTVTRNGVYDIRTIPTLQSFTTSGPGVSGKNAEAGSTVILKFKSIRFKDGEKITAPKLGWSTNDKFYIDKDDSGSWLVAKKNTKYTESQAITPLLGVADEEFGDAICSDINNQWLVVGQKSKNKLQIYTPKPVNMTHSAVIETTIPNIDELGASISTGSPTERPFKNNENYIDHRGKYEEWDNGKRWIVAGAPNSNSGKGAVLFYYYDAKSGTFLPGTISQPLGLTTSAKFGTDVKMSANELWCVVSAPGDKKVFVYNRVYAKPDAILTQTFIGDGSDTTFTLTSLGSPGSAEELYIRIGGTDYVAGRDYTYNPITKVITFTTAPVASSDISVTSLGGWRLVETFTGTDTDYGKTISIDSQGRHITIGSPNRSTVGDDSTSRMGAVEVKTRHWQCFVGDGTTKTFTAEGSSASYITVAVNGTNITKQPTVWSSSGNTITFVTAPITGDEIALWTDRWRQLQMISPSDIAKQVDGQFGSSSIAIDESAQTVYVGVPERDGVVENSGTVSIFERNQNIVNDKCVVTSSPEGFTSYNSGESFFINGYKVTSTTTTLSGIVIDINNANIPGITASSAGTVLTVTSSVGKMNSIIVTPGVTGTIFKDIGLAPWFNSTTLTLNQEITAGHKFGENIKVSRNNNLLVVGCPSGSSRVYTTVDLKNTIFDSSGTRFTANRFFTGSTHVFQKLGNSWVEADNLYTNNLSSNDKFGSSIAITNDTIYVSAPLDDDGITLNTGKVLTYKKTGDLFSVDAKEEPLVDIDRINKVFLYNKETNKIVTYLDYIDPIKGKIIGAAEQNIDYKTTWDPAVYNYSDGTKDVNKSDAYWNQDIFIGKIWWDINELKFINYEQGNADYKSLFWGGLFPGSTIGIYQWTESTVKPSVYTGGTAKYGDSAYVEIQKINTITNLLETKYYFWATSKTTVHEGKTLSTETIKKLITDPVTNGSAYAQFIGKNQVALVNTAKYIEANNTVLAVEYDKKPNDKILHTEWELIPEGSTQLEIPVDLFKKIKDSLAGADKQGNIVPDINLSVGDKYGIDIRPRQGVFMNRYLALKEYITYVNAVIKKYNISDSLDYSVLNEEEPLPLTTSLEYNETVNSITELGYIRVALKETGYKVAVITDSVVNGRWSIHTLQSDNTWLRSRTQSYDTKKFWAFIDWYDTGYSTDTNIDYRYTDFNKVYENATTIADKSIIKITKGTSWDLYIKTSGKHTLIGQKDGTLKFGDDLYDYVKTSYGFDTDGYDFNLMDTEPQIETRNIIDAIKDQILVHDLKNEHNKLMFVLLKFVLQEQSHVDWMFKTSFIQVKHNLRALDQFPTYQRDNQEFVKSYINEVKPYHSKIREYVLGYTKLETYLGDTSDFDLPATYDSITKTFRSPNKEKGHDATTLTTNTAYKMWKDNHSYYVDDIRINWQGTGYTTAPVITIAAAPAGGVTATATCTISGGRVNSVTVTTKGSGYLTTPAITITGGSPTIATNLYAVIKNNNIRKIKETLKFDRIKFSSDVKTWTKNTAYTTTNIIQHLKEAYTVNTGFTSGATFDSDNLTIKADATFNNAMDRTMAYYSPKAGQDAVDLGAIFKGITYPGTKVQGPLFSDEPNFDHSAFDTEPFDNFEIDSDGRFILSSKDIDLTLQGKFDDTQLGLRPEDIIVDGSSKFVDAYSSHAPEEFVPGRVFDSLSINVFTSPSTDTDNDDALGFPIYSINYKGDGTNKVFKFGDDKTGTDQAVLVYSRSSGKVSSTLYTVDWVDNKITFTTAPVNNEIIHLTSFGNTGNSVLLDFEQQAIAGQTVVNLPIAYSLISTKQNFITVNGVHNTTGTLAAGGTETTWTPATALSATDQVRVMLFDVASSATRTFSKVTIDDWTVTDSTRTFTLTDGADTFLARTDKIIVELNGTRLRPPVFTYLTNDSSSATYDLSTKADIDHATLTKSDTRVYINGVQTTNYSIVTGSDSTIKAVQLDEAPSASSKIDVAVTTNADYILTDATTLTITGGTWSGSDSLVVTTFNNHNKLKVTTETFKGGSTSAITTDIGFDVRGFESVPFDAVTASVVNIAEFSLFRNPTNVSYLWVTKNGVKMVPNYDYKLLGSKLAFASTLQATDITIITQFTEEIIQPAIGFKIFKDLFDKNHYYRISNKHKATTAAELLSSHTEIVVNNAQQFAVPDDTSNMPGIVWIGGERIEYLHLDIATNTISRLRRGTSGTHIPASHPIHSDVIDVSTRQEIPSAHDKTWYTTQGSNASNGLGLQNSTTTQANFLLDEPTYIKS